jgi:hypothetical protein
MRWRGSPSSTPDATGLGKGWIYITLPPGGSDAVAAGEGVFERVEFVTCLQVQKTLSGPESPTFPQAGE